MRKLRILTAGESHGKAIYGIIEGVPAGLSLSPEDFNEDMKRRLSGIGRSRRASIERDKVEIESGISKGKTTGAPITIRIENAINFGVGNIEMNYKGSYKAKAPLMVPRPGHADFVGIKKFNLTDINDVIERASARETAVRCALGCIAKKFLSKFEIFVYSRVLKIADIEFQYQDLYPTTDYFDQHYEIFKKEILESYRKNKKKLQELRSRLHKTGDTCGGSFQIISHKMPIGLGSYTQADCRLDALLASALMSIPSVKGVTFGAALEPNFTYGTNFVDKFRVKNRKILRESNNAGGIEGGISNGEPILIKGYVKPVPTLSVPVKSFNMKTLKESNTIYVNSDLWVVEAVGVIAESMVALVLMDEFLSKFGGNSIHETHRHFKS